MKTVFVLNGPNLNMLGKREPGIYGGKTLKDIEADCIAAGRDLGFSVDFRQSNHEGMLVDWLHEADDKAVGVAINAGAYTHTSIALYDAIRAISVPVVEADTETVIAWLKERGIKTLAATPHTDLDYASVDLSVPVAIVVGSEQYGLHSRWMEQADLQVKIPMMEQADSLNVAAAATILLYETLRQRRQAGIAQPT